MWQRVFTYEYSLLTEIDKIHKETTLKFPTKPPQNRKLRGNIIASFFASSNILVLYTCLLYIVVMRQKKLEADSLCKCCTTDTHIPMTVLFGIIKPFQFIQNFLYTINLPIGIQLCLLLLLYIQYKNDLRKLLVEIFWFQEQCQCYFRCNFRFKNNARLLLVVISCFMNTFLIPSI